MYKKIKLLAIAVSASLPMLISLSCNDTKTETQQSSNISKNDSGNTKTTDNSTEKDTQSGSTTPEPSKDGSKPSEQPENSKDDKGSNNNENPSTDTNKPDSSNASNADVTKEGETSTPPVASEPDSSGNSSSDNPQAPNNEAEPAPAPEQDTNNNEFRLEAISLTQGKSDYNWDNFAWEAFSSRPHDFQSNTIYYIFTANKKILKKEEQMNVRLEKANQATRTVVKRYPNHMVNLIWNSDAVDKNFSNFDSIFNNENTTTMRKMLEEIYYMIRLVVSGNNFYSTFADREFFADEHQKLAKYIADNYNLVKSRQKNLENELQVTTLADGVQKIIIKKEYVGRLLKKIFEDKNYIPYYYELILIYYYIFDFVKTQAN
ncbi:hypothetical protein [Mycoplasmopsis edwardii]|uniref:Uncharacterized protein n=1 Tax=Mycoplasmopsis edwardii TaxID=53558 RepID=A0ACD4PI00_9BACT|nr:hypothetical protein [Mycoplasmopsis edwardii]WBP84141.1 hypothetical protein Me_995_000093 [Mycoplasmopsis edwardii]